jgi:hypothetical protein
MPINHPDTIHVCSECHAVFPDGDDGFIEALGLCVACEETDDVDALPDYPIAIRS